MLSLRVYWLECGSVVCNAQTIRLRVSLWVGKLLKRCASDVPGRPTLETRQPQESATAQY